MKNSVVQKWELGKHTHLEGKIRESVHSDLTSSGQLLASSAGKSMRIRKGGLQTPHTCLTAALCKWAFKAEGDGSCQPGAETASSPQGWQQRLPELLVGNFI